MSNKIYVAAPWTHRAHAEDVAKQLIIMGYNVTYPWWAIDGGSDAPEFLTWCAGKDAEAVRACDVFLLLNLEKSEGKAFESGMAYTLGKELVGVGTVGSNLFQWLPEWRWFGVAGDALDYLHERLEACKQHPISVSLLSKSTARA